MVIKSTLNYSPNFNPIKRSKNKIKFIIFHYTGMKKESAAIQRLTNIQSEVSSHYFIKRSGKVITMLPNSYIAWHAGRSSWKKYKSLNENSIGIEISNPGHSFNYKKFSKSQINSIIELSNFLIKEYSIDQKNILGHSDIAPARKKDPGEKFPWKYLAKSKVSLWHTLTDKELKKNRKIIIDKKYKKNFLENLFIIGYSRKIPKSFNKNKYLALVVKAFQRRYRQELINGEIDKECLMISNNLLKNYHKF